MEVIVYGRGVADDEAGTCAKLERIVRHRVPSVEVAEPSGATFSVGIVVDQEGSHGPVFKILLSDANGRTYRPPIARLAARPWRDRTLEECVERGRARLERYVADAARDVASGSIGTRDGRAVRVRPGVSTGS